MQSLPEPFGFSDRTGNMTQRALAREVLPFDHSNALGELYRGIELFHCGECGAATDHVSRFCSDRCYDVWKFGAVTTEEYPRVPAKRPVPPPINADLSRFTKCRRCELLFLPSDIPTGLCWRCAPIGYPDDVSEEQANRYQNAARGVHRLVRSHDGNR